MSFSILLTNESIMAEILEYLEIRQLRELYDNIPEFQRIIEKYRIPYRL